MVTPGNGVQWQADFTHEASGIDGPRPAVAQADPRREPDHRLRVARRGDLDRGRDHATWLSFPTTAAIGMFVTSPPTGMKTVRRSPTSTESSPDYTLSTAVFDSVSLTGADGEPVTGVLAAPGHQRTTARAARHTAWRARTPRMPAG